MEPGYICGGISPLEQKDSGTNWQHFLFEQCSLYGLLCSRHYFEHFTYVNYLVFMSIDKAATSSIPILYWNKRG